MLANTQKLLFKTKQPFKEGVHKAPHKSEIKIDYIKLNILLLQLRRNGFFSDEGKIADKLEATFRFDCPKNTLRLKAISSLINLGNFKNQDANLLNFIKLILDGEYDGLIANSEFWNLILDRENDLSKLFFIEKFGNVSDLLDDLGIQEQYLESDLSCFEIKHEDQKAAYFDSGLNVEYQFEYEPFSFYRNTKAVKVLNKNAFRLYLKKYIETNNTKGWFSVFDISKMGFANKVVSDDGKVVYGDPYMAEFTAVAQVIINRYLPRFGLKGVLGRIGGDEFGFHLTGIDGNAVDKVTADFVSSLFYCLITKIEFIRANEGDIVGLSRASFKNNEKPIFNEIDDDIAKLIGDLNSIPDQIFHEAENLEKTKQIHELEKYQSELREILASKIGDKTLAQILSESATKMEIANNGGIKISDEQMDLKLLDSFSGVRFQGLNTLGSGHVCFISIPFMKDVNDEFGSVMGDTLKAKFEIAFFKELATLPEAILNRISIHKKTPKIILRFDKEGISDADLTVLNDFIFNLSNIKITINSDGSTNQKEYPILFSQSKSTKIIDLRERIDNLDEDAVIGWLKKIISKGYFLDIQVMNFLNSKKNGAPRTKKCLDALTAMSTQSTTLLRETIEFFDKMCSLAGDKDAFNKYLNQFCASLNENSNQTDHAEKDELVSDVMGEQEKELAVEDVGDETDIISSSEFYVVNDLNYDQRRLLITLNAMLQFNRQNGTINGLADGEINDFFTLTLTEVDYIKVSEVYELLLRNYLAKFLTIAVKSNSDENTVLIVFIDLLKDFTQKQNKIFNETGELIRIDKYTMNEFNILLKIFCKNFFKSLEYLRGVLNAVKVSEQKLMYLEASANM